jgi:hypothetical protein
MPVLNLKNITIDQRQMISGENFFMIKDQDSNQVFFCFEDKLKNNWQELANNYQNIKEVEIEYLEQEKGNKVISLQTFKEEVFV